MRVDFHEDDEVVRFEPMRPHRHRLAAPQGAREWHCGNKQPFPSMRRAKLKLRHWRESMGRDVVAYHCQVCKSFHIGNNTRF